MSQRALQSMADYQGFGANRGQTLFDIWISLLINNEVLSGPVFVEEALKLIFITG